ncbi:MAG: glycogen debranching enzyme N-terminal domain-containing protein [Chloroflexi bacterium]|nr:glycogen debranching enzyme N-terminal domain-containing protein [Ktedonobacteraceae bacterium]MBV9708043.1 glycogen debranching enzyme N-terminal domain-containing protein [Chloroflexota bacterium]
MPIILDRSACCDFSETTSREWLVANGIGGYAAGTVSGMLTRMEHGLLVAALPERATPQLLLAKIDEEVVFDQRSYDLGTNEYRDGTLNPAGFVNLETFRLEEGFPTFTYHLGGLSGFMLQKRIWMPQGHNTTYIQYRMLRTVPTEQTGSGYQRSGTTRALYNDYYYAQQIQRTLQLTLLPFVAYRPYNEPQHGSNDKGFQVEKHPTEDHVTENEQQFSSFPQGVAGCTIRAWPEAHHYHILAIGHAQSQVTFLPTGVWYWNFLRRLDANAGRPATDDLYLPGVIRATLWPGEDATLTIIVSAEELSSLPLSQDRLQHSYTRSVEAQRQLVAAVLHPQRFFGEAGETAQAKRVQILPLASQKMSAEEYLHLLLQAANRFFVRRTASPRNGLDHNALFSRPERMTLVLSNYYTMQTRTRDMLISLPGIAVVTGKYEEVAQLLRRLARHFKQGLLPDCLPQPDYTPQESDYGSVDTTLWFFYAFDHYLRATHDYELLNELYHSLAESIGYYRKGTLHGIRVDSDGLLQAQEQGKALTWMNSLVDGRPSTPRSGKPIEVNALWYHALSLMHEWSSRLYYIGRLISIPSTYQDQLVRCKRSFEERFWYATGGYLYDVIDGPLGNDASLRPNQLLALSLRHSLLEDESQRQSVFEAVSRHLLTPYGLRTLAPYDAAYRGAAEQDREQQRVLHQGSVWTWLIGPYIDVLLSAATTQHKQYYQKSQWQKSLQLLETFQAHFYEELLGMSAGIFSGDVPHRTIGDRASVISVGELLRVYDLLSQIKLTYVIDLVPERV